MSIHFYKLQTGGNGFILIDTQERQNVPFFPAPTIPLKKDIMSRFSAAAYRLCNKRYGIGASGIIFLRDDKSQLLFDAKGRSRNFSADAFLCAGRYLFDSGRVNGKHIEFTVEPDQKSPEVPYQLTVLGSRDFRLSMGVPFSMETGTVITRRTTQLLQTLQIEKTTAAAAALHIQDDVISLFSSPALPLSLQQLSYNFSRLYPGKNMTAVIVRNIQQNSTVIQCTAKGMSSACAAAAAAVATTVLSGSADDEQIIYFEDNPGSVTIPTDSNGTTGRRLGVSWQEKDNAIYITGSGDYLFDGSIDIPEFTVPEYMK